MKWRPENQPCPICRSSRPRVIGRRGGPAHHRKLGEETTVVQCASCKTFYTSPVLIPEGNPYDEHSPENYFEHHDPNKKIEKGRQFSNIALSYHSRPGRLLEIGCGRGELLQGAKESGWEVFGIKMTEAFAKEAEKKGIMIERSPAETSQFLAQKEHYDVILMAAILEHLYEPGVILDKATQALKPGGLLFIDVPNEESLLIRIFNFGMRLLGKNWAMNLSPTFRPFHVVGFSPAGLRKVLKTKGYEILSLKTPPWTFRFSSPNVFKEKAVRFTGETIKKVGAFLGCGDGIVCWARKK